MMTRKEIKQNQKLAQALFNKAGIVITKQEAGSIEVADLGLAPISKRDWRCWSM